MNDAHRVADRCNGDLVVELVQGSVVSAIALCATKRSMSTYAGDKGEEVACLNQCILHAEVVGEVDHTWKIKRMLTAPGLRALSTRWSRVNSGGGAHLVEDARWRPLKGL